MDWIYWKLMRLRFVFYTQMLCPLGIHRRIPTNIQRYAGFPVDAAKCVFCGARR